MIEKQNNEIGVMILGAGETEKKGGINNDCDVPALRKCTFWQQKVKGWEVDAGDVLGAMIGAWFVKKSVSVRRLFHCWTLSDLL